MAKPLVGIVMGSTSDWDVMQHAARSLADFDALSNEAFVAFLEPPSLDDRIVNQFAAAAAEITDNPASDFPPVCQ